MKKNSSNISNNISQNILNNISNKSSINTSSNISNNTSNNTSKEEIVTAGIEELFGRRGFSRVRVNHFEEYELYLENKNFLNTDSVITFMDSGGRLMALKPDVTLSIVKNCSGKRFSYFDKLYYIDHVCRLSKDTGEYKMLKQIGAEIIGPVDSLTNLEILDLALESLGLISDEFVVDISHQEFVSALLDDAQLTYAAKQSVLKALHTKSAHTITALLDGFELPEDHLWRIRALAGISGPVAETIGRAREIIVNSRMEEAWKELSDIGSMLEVCGVSQKVRLDFSVVNDLDYYNGLSFIGYVKGVPNIVLTGGRYDNLMKKMGKKNSAIGFAVFLSDLNTYFKRDRVSDFDILLTYEDGCDYPSLLMEAKRLCREGKSVRLEPCLPNGLRFSEHYHFGKAEGGFIKC